MLIDIIAGARPNFMKVAPVIRALERHRSKGGHLRYRLVHTGQHYDRNMSGAFFEQLGIPEPDVNLQVGSGSQANQTAEIMVRYERLLMELAPALCLVVGDVTSTMACAITAKKSGIRVAHIEGGIRSGDMTMPEEVNRIVTDSITDWFFTTSESAGDNLRKTGVEDDRIFFVGNTMIDTLLVNEARFSAPEFWVEQGLTAGEYLVVTLHRPSNVDSRGDFSELLRLIGANSRGLPIIYPVHPRTAETIRQLPELPSSLVLVEPQPYLQFNYLVKNSRAVITDSGGVTEETTVMGVPCLTLRENTERPETVELGTNELVGTSHEAIRTALNRLFEGEWKGGRVPPLWDGHAGERIIDALSQLLPPAGR